MPLTKLVCLDRDGTINHDVKYLGRNDNWQAQLKIYDGVADCIKQLRTSPDIYISVISNQAGIALGYFNESRVQAINSEIAERLAQEHASIDSWHFCPWVTTEYADAKDIKLKNWVDDKMASLLRKPATGMVRLAAEALKIDLKYCYVYVIGDKVEDVQTGLNANGTGILFDNGENSKEVAKLLQMRKHPEYQNRTHIAANLEAAANLILNSRI